MRIRLREGHAGTFLILAFSTQGTNEIEEIQSLDYYDHPGVFQIMQATEDKTGETIFTGGNTGGLGYVDPLYLREEKVSSNRWRPWAPEQTVSEAQAVETDVLDALLYAMFPGDAKLPDDLQSSMPKLGWNMPLIKNKGHNNYVFTRLPLAWKGGRGEVDNVAVAALSMWQEDAPVASRAGLPSVVESLTEQADLRQGLLTERKAFWDKVLCEANIARGTPAFVSIIKLYADWVRGNFVRGGKEDANTQVWQKLLDRINRFLS